MRICNVPAKELDKLWNLINKLDEFDYTFEAQSSIRFLEDKIVQNNNAYIIYNNDDLKNPSILHYLYLTSIPFVNKDIKDYDFSGIIDNLWEPGHSVCKKCPTLITRLTMPTGSLTPKYLLLTDAPGVYDGAKNIFDRVMVYGNTSHFFRNCLIKTNMYLNSWFTNLLKCSTPKNRSGFLTEYTQCLDNLLKEIRILKPRYILLFGKNVSSFFDSHISKKLTNKFIFRLNHPTWYIYTNKQNQLVIDLQKIYDQTLY